MTVKYRGPNCECCEDCEIVADTFNVSDTTTVTGWTEVAGDSSIESNQLRVPAGALIVNNTSHPDGNAGKSRVRATATPDYNIASTVTGRLIIAYADASNYLFVQVTFVEDSCITVRLGIREAASETWLTDALSISPTDGDTITLYLCWVPPTGSGSDYVEGQLGLNINGALLSCLSAETAGIEGDQWGLAASAGDILVDNFKAEYHYDSATHPACPRCACTSVCSIFTDDFDGRTTLGCFTEVVSTVSVADGVMTIEASGAVVANATPQTDQDAIRVVQTIRTDDATATLRIRVGYDDESNYLFVEIALASSVVTARLGKRVSSSDTYLTDAKTIESLTSLSTATEVQVCLRPGEHLDEVEAIQFRTPLKTTALSGATDWQIPDPTIPAANYLFSLDPETTPALLFGQFLFTIPAGSTIDGIEIIANVEYEADQSTVIDDAIFYFFGDPVDQSDDMAYNVQVPDNGTATDPPGNIGWGGCAALSGGDPTWDEINSHTFSISMVFTNTGFPLSNDELDVYDVIVAVCFTTPPRSPGRLQASIGGECITAYNITHETGSQVGYLASSGDWEIDDFSLGYMESPDHPSCPNCGEVCSPPGSIECEACCGEDLLPASIAVSFGTTAFRPDECECTFWNGTIILDYILPISCAAYVYYNYLGNCAIGSWYQRSNYIFLRLLVDYDEDDEPICRWTLDLGFLGLTDTAPADSGDGLAFVRYESDIVTDCTAFPVTLSKVVDNAFPACLDDSFPLSIEIDSA